jgi:hypothetical protein
MCTLVTSTLPFNAQICVLRLLKVKCNTVWNTNLALGGSKRISITLRPSLQFKLPSPVHLLRHWLSSRTFQYGVTYAAVQTCVKRRRYQLLIIVKQSACGPLVESVCVGTERKVFIRESTAFYNERSFRQWSPKRLQNDVTHGMTDTSLVWLFRESGQTQTNVTSVIHFVNKSLQNAAKLLTSIHDTSAP